MQTIAKMSQAEAAPRQGISQSDGPERGMFHLVLRDHRSLNRLLLDDAALPGALNRLLGLALLGLTIHGALVGLILRLAASPSSVPWGTAQHIWLVTPVAYPAAFLLALAVCLPSFYFYTQLSGLDASFRLVSALALRVLATTSVLLLGVLPFYAAVALGSALGIFGNAEAVALLGLALPFLVGLFGIDSLRRSLQDLRETLPVTRLRRGRCLTRLSLAWAAVFTAVAPVALYRIGEALVRVLR
jgi:hypothetical protein